MYTKVAVSDKVNGRLVAKVMQVDGFLSTPIIGLTALLRLLAE